MQNHWCLSVTGGAALHGASRAKGRIMGVPLSSEFGPGIRLFCAVCALGPQPPAAGLWASAFLSKF
eukprot:6452738-Alexandrium_andersonii.AAC.1